MIKGYVEGDRAIMQEIDRKAVGMAFLIVILCGLIYAMVLAAVKIVEWAGSFFSNKTDMRTERVIIVKPYASPIGVLLLGSF